jgi:CheY-like chemotaxis protein
MKILVIEDEHGSAYQAKQLLAGSDHPILNLEVVGALSTGLERLQNGGVDAVLLDLNLPDSSGADTFQRVRNCAPDIPIVLLNDGQITQAVPKKGLNGHGPALKQALNLARERSQLMAMLLTHSTAKVARSIRPDFRPDLRLRLFFPY